jgi:ribosome biogenesis protein YTM1
LGATSCTWVSPAETTSDILLAAGGVDRAVHVFSLPSLDPDVAASENNTAREVYTLMGHTGPVSAVLASEEGREIVSASWDGQLNLYIVPSEEPTEHQVPADPTSYLPGQKKRRKLHGDAPRIIEGYTDGDATGEAGQGWRRTPDIVFRGHHGRIGSATWDKEDPTRIWSAGWDGSVRGWDAETGANLVIRVSLNEKESCL